MPQSERNARFYSLIWPHAPAVLRLARILTHCDADAEDLSQETMLKAFNGLDSLHDAAGVKSWLMTILRHCHIDRTRKRKTQVSYDALEIELAAPPQFDHRDDCTPQELLESFSNEQMIDALRRLPQEIRWTLLLVDVEGLKEADAAEMLAIPVGTIKSRLHRGRHMLYDALLPLAKSFASPFNFCQKLTNSNGETLRTQNPASRRTALYASPGHPE